MKFKISANIQNEIGATTELSEVQLENLTNGIVSSSGISLSGGDEIQIVCDLFNRYSLDTCKYYYSGDGSVIVEVAESYNLWSIVSSTAGSGFVEIPLSEYTPRWIRITHNISSSAEVYEVEIYNSDSNILFGFSGNFSSYGLDASGDTIQAVQVFNSTDCFQDINILIDDDLDEAGDDLLSVGLSSSGPFYSKHERGLCFPDDFEWDKGVHNETMTTVSGHLTVSGVSTSGTYYSPVFNIIGYNDCRFFWEQDYNQGSKVDYVSSVDSENCFGVRMYHLPPSGIWLNGEMPSESDLEWSLETGSLLFESVPNNTILEFRDRSYIQFTITLSGVVSPHIYKAGVETPLTVSGIGSNQYKEVYLQMNTASTTGSQLGLICWYRE